MAYGDDGSPIGEVAYFSNANGAAYLANRWLICNGATLSQATYPALFARLGLINNGGTIWTSRTSGTTTTINALTFGSVFVFFGNSLYVYAGGGGALATSVDAITWTARTSGTSSAISSITYGGAYVYVSTAGLIASSTDAITWTARNSPTVSNLTAIAFGNSKYVAVGQSGTIVTSTDGTTWNTKTPSIGSNAPGP